MDMVLLELLASGDSFSINQHGRGQSVISASDDPLFIDMYKSEKMYTTIERDRLPVVSART